MFQRVQGVELGSLRAAHFVHRHRLDLFVVDDRQLRRLISARSHRSTAFDVREDLIRRLLLVCSAHLGCVVDGHGSALAAIAAHELRRSLLLVFLLRAHLWLQFGRWRRCGQRDEHLLAAIVAQQTCGNGLGQVRREQADWS